MTVDVRQSSIGSIVLIDELFVIDAKQMQNGSMKVVIADRIADCFPRPFVGLADGKTTGTQPNLTPVGVLVKSGGCFDSYGGALWPESLAWRSLLPMKLQLFMS